jgi:hypothetical protein
MSSANITALFAPDLEEERSVRRKAVRNYDNESHNGYDREQLMKFKC